MIYTIIVILFLLVLMTTIVFFVVKKTIERVNNTGKIYFTTKIQEYELEKEKNEEKEKKVEKDINKIQQENGDNKQLIYVEKKLDFEVDDVFKLAKLVEDKFYVNSKKIVENFIKKNSISSSNSRYNDLVKLKSKLSNEKIYEILTCNFDEVKNIICEYDSKIMNEYQILHEKFDLYDFINYIDSEIAKVDPTIYVFVGNQKENYNYIDSRIKTIYKDTIYKGIIIVYQNKMYDYSLS